MDRDGFISNGDLFRALKLFTKDELDDIQIQQLADRTMIQVDMDKDGKISFEDFVSYARKDIDVADMFSFLMFNS
jgi:serine/threonine-protein phosphatase 2B regulatory subunit